MPLKGKALRIFQFVQHANTVHKADSESEPRIRASDQSSGILRNLQNVLLGFFKGW